MTRKYLAALDEDERATRLLPGVCCARLHDGQPILIKNGVNGYFTLAPLTNVERFNLEREITAAQVKAMRCGSMFGFDVPAADPRFHEILR